MFTTYFLRPVIVGAITVYDEIENKTVAIKILPLSRWFPFDEQKYYMQSFCWQILDGAIGASCVAYTDIFTFSLIIFPLGQIGILNHILHNAHEYILKVKIQLNCSMEEASFLAYRECILEHKKIIR